MVDINLNVNINAEPGKVYEALIEEEHFKAWWTPDVKIENNKIRFEFNPYGDYVVVEVVKKEQNLIEWKVTDSKMLQTDDWVGTTITFEINKSDNGTDLVFVHTNWKSETECYKKCTDGWQHFIGSLKSYLETGKGQPFKPE